MLNGRYNEGRAAALTHFKVANLMAGAAAYNPTINPGASGAMAPAIAPPKPVAPAAPIAAGAPKANVLG